MRLVMTLLVRDEVDIVRANIEFHLSQGVDFIIAMDNLSVDGTAEVLAEYERAGGLRLMHQREDDYAQGVWVTQMARLACTEHGADWIINNDADEFWWPVGGSLASVLATAPPEVGRLRVQRTNFVATQRTDEPFFERQLFRGAMISTNALGHPLPPKVCHRASPRAVVAQGNHDAEGVVPDGIASTDRVEILHFPLRSYAQFESKIRAGGAAYERNGALPRHVGGTWRHCYDLLRQGRLREHYEEQALSPTQIDEGLRTGRLVRDVRLRDHLSRTTPRTGRSWAARSSAN